MDLVSSAGRRGGTRGGKDQFKWDDVKNDKYRENYLGHSLHAPVGRWQEGKDLLWYARDKGSAEVKDQRRKDMETIRKRENEMMKRTLGGLSRVDAVKDTLREELERREGGDVEAGAVDEERKAEKRRRKEEKKLKKKMKKEKKEKKRKERETQARERGETGWSSSSDDGEATRRNKRRRAS